MRNASETYWSALHKALGIVKSKVLEPGFPALTAIQGIPRGKFVVLCGRNTNKPYGKSLLFNAMSASLSGNTTKRKHPNRPIKLAKNRLERGEFDHLKKGRVCKISVNKAHPVFSRQPLYLHKTANLMKESRIAIVQDGSMSIYLETVQADLHLFHKVLVDDQVGYMHCSHAQFSLKRLTSRMLRRLNTQDFTNEIEES